MDSNQLTQVQALNEYIMALQRQIKSFQNERQILLQQLTNTEKINDKSDHELIQLKNDLKQMNSILYRQTVEKTNADIQVKFLTQENDKLKKQVKYNEQKIEQLNNIIKEKNDLLAKEKHNTYLTSTFHTKQMVGLEEKLKQLEKKLSLTVEQKLVANVQFDLAQQNLQKQKQEKEQLNAEVQRSKAQVQGLRKQDQLSKDQIQALSLKLKDLQEKIQRLSFQILHGNQDNLELKKSYDSLMESVKLKHQQKLKSLHGQIQSQRSEIQRFKEETQVLKQSIQGLNTSLALETANYKRQFQNCKELSHQITQLNKEIQRLQKQINDEVTDKGSVLSGKEMQFQDLMKKFSSLKQELQRKQLQRQVDLENSNKKYFQFQKKSQFEILTKQEQINKLSESLSLKIFQIQELNQNIYQTKSQLLKKARQHEQKVKQCLFLHKKQKKVQSQFEAFRAEIQGLKIDENSESIRMRNKIEELDSEIVEFLRRETKITKQLKQSQSKLSKTLQEFEQHKRNFQQRQTQAKKKIRQVQRQLQQTKKEYQQKEERLRGLGDQNEFKSKEHANKEQQLQRKYSEIEAKCCKVKSKLILAEKQLQQKDQDHNKMVERLLVQHKNQLKENRIKLDEQVKKLQAKIKEQISQLTFKLEDKSTKIKQLQNQINQLKRSSLNKLQLDHSEMEKKMLILQQQLESTRNRTNSNNQNFINYQIELEKLKQQLAQKELQLEIITSALEKTRKDNQWLYNEATHLRQQVDALQSSTTYLKRQIASALDKHQGSLKEIRLLKETNRQMSKLASSKTILTDRSDLLKRTRAKTVKMQIAQSNFSIDNDVKSVQGNDHNDTLEESEAMHSLNFGFSPKEQVTKMFKWLKKETNDGDFP